MKIKIKVFEHLFDEEPAATHEFASQGEAQAWLEAQPGTLTLEIEAA